MKKSNALFRMLVALVVPVVAVVGAANAKPYPDHTIRMVTPFAPGGGTDILMRILTPNAGERLGESVVVENKPGAATMIGTGQVVRSAPDGYTLLASDSAILINPGLYKDKLPYDTLNDLQSVTMLATAPVILVVHPSVKAETLEELIALAKAQPGKLAFSSGGMGAGTHLAGELFKLKADVDMLHVPYNGTSPGLNAVISGDVQMMFGGISSARPFVENGKLRAIAVTGEQRNAAMPDVPTFAEKGLDVNASSYWGIYAPAGVPKDIVQQVSEAFAATVNEPDIVEKIAGLGYTPIGNTPEEHDKQWHAMIEQWKDVIEQAQVEVQQ